MAANIPQKVYVVKVGKPILVINRPGFLVVKTDEAVKLDADSFGVGIKLLITQHFPHFGFSRRVSNPGGAAAQQGYTLMPRVFQMPEREIGNHMADMQTPACGVGAFVKRNRPLVHQF